MKAYTLITIGLAWLGAAVYLFVLRVNSHFFVVRPYLKPYWMPEWLFGALAGLGIFLIFGGWLIPLRIGFRLSRRK
jgi:hypothetical protein